MNLAIAKNFDEGFEIVRGLVATFHSNADRYRKPDYSEQDARNDFINKFWMALGWDVLHDEQRNPYEQEVRVERGVTIDARRKRADYAFFVAPNFRDVRFYVEAKKPSVELDNRDAYFQTIRYGWNSQTPLAVLTDFEQFRILDARYKPDIANVMQTWVKKYEYDEYEDEAKFREIYHLFSRESVAAGSIEKYVEDFLPMPKGAARRSTLFQLHSQSIDAAFLSDLDTYRARLAGAFKSKNPTLDGFELTEVTQRTLDRLIFMRFLEDKLIETEPLIENLGSRAGSAWQDFKAVSRRLDKTYNGIIFKEHFLDRADFQIDEAVFGDIRESLAHANSPYDFNAIPIHILGSIYERFLGKVIVATSEGAKVEEKPEVRKAGGVYYTPEYIVRYIVENTVRRLI